MTATPEAAGAAVREAMCPACGHYVAVPFFHGGDQPLATLAWPASGAAARAMKRLPLDFVRCVECGHIFNVGFDYAEVPYSEKPNLMFNRGRFWSDFIRAIRREMLELLPERPTVVEIGHGDASFLSALAEARPAGRYIGFDPHGASAGAEGLELRAELFDPVVHLPETRPDLVVGRHVLEHLTNPLGFLQRLAFAAARLGVAPLAYLEVPCIDRVLETGRTVDFYYEHSSQFTTTSFARMLSRAAGRVERIGHGYDGEVIYGFVRLGGTRDQVAHATAAEAFRRAAATGEATIRAQLRDLHAAGRRVAIWGGTGKSAAFIARYGVDAERFPLVVDSDPAKVGTFVPGAGQEIVGPKRLRDRPIDAIIIPPQWRARDIMAEIRGLGIAAAQILIEHEGRLVDYLTDAHPYR